MYAGRCPICKEDTELTFKPFCSNRCQYIDLNHWLVGTYAIDSSEPDPSVPLKEKNNGD